MTDSANVASSPGPKRHTLLVIDDEPAVVKSVQDLFRRDYRVLGATSGADGLRLLEQEEVHVVMTDQRMPSMTGIELLSHVRGEHPDAIRLLFTGHADIRAVIDAINQGSVYRYIVKPWDPEELQSIIREATERYDLIVEKKRLFHELEHKNDLLEHANKELAHASELKTAFIQVAGHELRGPLTILLALIQLAQRQAAPPGPSRDWIERAGRASGRLHRIVDQLTTMLSVGRLEPKIERTPTDLGVLLREVEDDVRPFVARRGQTLHVEPAPELGEMRVDAPKIHDSLEHLLMNAIKFTPDGGTIRVTASRTAAGGAQISVADSGIGIDAASLPRIFTPFFTELDPSHHSSGDFEFGRRGMGLGLTIAKAFIVMHGGDITVESEPSRGTTFTIDLPDAGG